MYMEYNTCLGAQACEWDKTQNPLQKPAKQEQSNEYLKQVCSIC